MSLCRLMVYDFMYGSEAFDPDTYSNTDMYDHHDLNNGLAYTEEYMAKGLQTEPFYGFPFKEFAQWCRNRLDKDPSDDKSMKKGEATVTKEKKAYQWDYDGQYKPEAAPYQQQQTFSVGIFQWIPRANGKGLKRSAVRYRIRGSYHNPDEVYAKAQAKCDELNKGEAANNKTETGTP